MRVHHQNIAMRYSGKTVLPILIWLFQVGSVGQVAHTASAVLASGAPLADIRDRLERSTGRVISYEDPILAWSGDLDPTPYTQRQYLFPRKLSFTAPPELTSEPNLGVALARTLDAYHHQTSGTRFRVLTSKLGYHIVPSEVRDSTGGFAPARNALDSAVAIPNELRTPMGHLLALGSAAGSSLGIQINVVAVPFKVGGFNDAFRSRPEKFSWGANAVARDALVDLLLRSATTFSWQLICQAAVSPANRFCALNVKAITVVITNANGQPDERVLWFDRCGDCPPLSEVMPPAQPKQPNQ